MNLLKFLDLEFGLSHHGVRQKRWVASAIGGAISLGSSIFGGIKSAEAEKKARKKEAEAHAKNMAWFRRRYDEDYSETAAGRNMLRKAKEYADANWKKAQGASAVGGASDVSTALAKEQGNKVYSDALSDMASTDVARKDSASKEMADEVSRHSDREAASLRQQGVNTAATAAAMGNAIGSIVSGMNSAEKTSGVGTDSEVNSHYMTSGTWNDDKSSLLGGSLKESSSYDPMKNFKF